MRVVLFFDLPTETPLQRREYRRFHTFLVKTGFVMMQESVYSKLALNPSGAEAVRRNVIQFSPPEGIVQLMTVTEKQYNNIECIVGKSESDVLNTDERLVIL